MYSNGANIITIFVCIISINIVHAKRVSSSFRCDSGNAIAILQSDKMAVKSIISKFDYTEMFSKLENPCKLQNEGAKSSNFIADVLRLFTIMNDFFEYVNMIMKRAPFLIEI